MEDSNPIKIRLEFEIPNHAHDLNLCLKGKDYACSLYDIYNECRNVWKYKIDATKEEIELAESIADLIIETRVLEDLL